MKIIRREKVEKKNELEKSNTGEKIF